MNAAKTPKYRRHRSGGRDRAFVELDGPLPGVDEADDLHGAAAAGLPREDDGNPDLRHYEDAFQPPY